MDFNGTCKTCGETMDLEFSSDDGDEEIHHCPNCGTIAIYYLADSQPWYWKVPTGATTESVKVE